MAELKITNLVKLYTVLLLYEKPTYGYEIIKEISSKLSKKASPGQIYPFLKMLTKKGYVKHQSRQEREKMVYSLTPSGRAFVKRMLVRFGGMIDIAIIPKLTVCAHCGCKVYAGGHSEQIKGKKLMFCCHHCADAYKTEL